MTDPKDADGFGLPRRVPAAEVKATFNIGDRALFDWEQRGWLTPIKIGRGKFYDAEEVVRLAVEGTHKKARKNKK